MNNKQLAFTIYLVGLYLVMACLIPLNLNSAALNHADQVLDNTYAVHATRNLPESDYLRAGFAVDHFLPAQKALFPKVRKTLHFSLGELVRPLEEFMSWDDCPYALVTPLRHLLPQLININCYDSFILGDLQLGSDTYLILPVEVAEGIVSQATIVTYDPLRKTLREAVDELILSKGGWHIEMDAEDIEDELHAAYIGEENINSSAFFGSIKEGRPWLAIGLRFDPLDGEHYRLSQIEMGTFVLMQLLFPVHQENMNEGQLESSYLEEIILGVTENFEHWSQSLTGFTWCSESQFAYQQLAGELKRWKNLIFEELRIRELYGKTLRLASDDFLLTCAALLNDPDALQAFINQNREQLLDYSVSCR